MASQGEAVIQVKLDEDTLGELREIAEALNSTPEEVAAKLLDIVASYKGLIVELANTLRVKREHKVDSVFEELVYYGVEAWRGILEPILRKLRASGRFELEMLEFDPRGPSLEVELVALEGSDLRADVVRLYLTPRGATMEVMYYLEEGIEPPMGVKVDLPWDYLPDEHAIVVTIQADNVDSLPPIHVVDRRVEALLP